MCVIRYYSMCVTTPVAKMLSVQYITRVAQSPLVLVKGKLENMKVLPVHW